MGRLWGRAASQQDKEEGKEMKGGARGHAFVGLGPVDHRGPSSKAAQTMAPCVRPIILDKAPSHAPLLLLPSLLLPLSPFVSQGLGGLSGPDEREGR